MTKFLFSFISSNIRRFFLKIHTSHFLCMRYICCNFGSDQSIIKDTLLSEDVPALVYLGFRCRDFSDTSFLALFAHVLPYVSYVSIA